MENVEHYPAEPSSSTKAHCGKCDAHFGNFYNSWQQVTGSYFRPSLPASYEVLSLTESKSPVAASSKSDLRGSEVLPLSCRSCSERLAIRIVETTKEQSHLLGCEIFKHKTIIFRDEDTNRVVPPHVVRSATTLNAPSGAVVHPTQGTVTSHREAFPSVNPTLQSSEPAMSASTVLPPIQRQLSGDRLPPILQSKSTQHSPHLPNSSLPVTNGSGYPTQFQVKMDAIDRIQTQVNYNRATLELQTREMKRMETAMTNIQHDIGSLFRLIEEMRRPGAAPRADSRANVDDSDLELFSQTLSGVAAKASEIDGIKLQMEVFKRKIKRLEEHTAGPVTPSASSQRESSVLPPPGSAAPLSSLADPRPHYAHHNPPSEQLEPQASGWATVNSGTKRPVLNDNDGYSSTHTPLGSPKRLKLAPLESRESYPSHHQRMDVDEYAIRRSSSFPEKANVAYLHQDQAEEAWRSEQCSSQRGRGASRGPGRPRKYVGPERAESAEWDREPAWSSTTYDMADHHRRGSGVIRRGSGGGFSGAAHAGIGRQLPPSSAIPGSTADPYAHTKKTRTKPTRNADGVLIRKDGRPDMRSQSSAANLRKVHARKEQERLAEMNAAGARRGSSQEWNGDSPQQPAPSAGANTPDTEGSIGVRDERESTDGSRQEDVVKQMLPRGVDHDKDRSSALAKNAGEVPGSAAMSPRTADTLAERPAAPAAGGEQRAAAEGEATSNGVGAATPATGAEAEAQQ